MNKLVSQLFKPVDIASIVFIRISLGIILSLDVLRYMATQNGKVFWKAIWIDPEFHFKYFGFGWVETVPETYLNLIVIIVALSALFVAIGFLYRISATIFFFGFSYLFLLEQAYYLNHYYLVILVSFLLIFIPANRLFSVDSLIWPKLRSNVISAWCLWLLMFQIGIVYFYAGVAKLNADWLQGWPLRMWLDDVGFSGIYKEIFIYSATYFGLLFDLLIVPMLLYRRTRIIGFTLAIIFHISNKLLFNIGVFPFLSLTLTTLYFSPSWPRKVFRLKRIDEERENITKSLIFKPETRRHLTVVFLSVYVVFQILFPLRHFIYPGNVSWNEEGHKFSWHMKLRDKDGKIRYFILDPETGKEWKLNPSSYLTHRQARYLSTRPNLMIQFAHYIEKQFKEIGYEDVEVRARALVSLNGRKKQLIIDPNVDLTKKRESMMHADWILPLEEPLKNKK